MKTVLLSAACIIAVGILLSVSVFPQSQSQNGQIEGTVSDQTGAPVSNIVITVTNIETGATRSVTTDESGVYRSPLLPLGTYRITAEAASFKKFIRDGITLTTGQTATIDVPLQTGDIKEVVTVSADTSVADAGKTDMGRVMNTREVQNLPLISRNPYNFALLQANVTGRPSRGFANPMINANGYLRRVNYLLDGNTNTEGTRGSLRLMLISDVYVSELQLVTNGFAAEFGNTPGLIMNVVTPSGTNALHGAVSYRFRRPSFYSRPFFFSSPEDVPDNRADDIAAAVGGPIVNDRWHFYFGYEYDNRDDKAAAVRLLTITPENRSRLIGAGLSASIFPIAVPFQQSGPYYIFRTDAQLNDKNRLSIRFNHSDILIKNSIQGMLNTLDRNVDAFTEDYALAAQIASYSSKTINELRLQHVTRTNPGTVGIRNETSGIGPSIVITSLANFGSPEGAGETDTIYKPLRITQFQDNLTQTLGEHLVKFGGGFNFYNDTVRSATFSRYTFSSIDAYIAARNGTNPRSYTDYRETFGEQEISYKAAFWNLFVQDDWKLTTRLKINYGLRYDLYKIPEADPASRFSASQEFNVDKNNLAPRIGVVFVLGEGNRPTILRLGAGIYYDQPLLAMYSRALQNNGNAGFFTLNFTPSSINAPAFPNTFSGSLPSGSVLPPQDIDTVAPDFETMYAFHSNIQLEQAITEDLSFAVGFIHSAGRHLPIYRNTNVINPIRSLADGRPVFSRTVDASTRFDPRFNNILMVESAASSEYNAVTLQLNRRFSRGLQFSLNYTLAKAADDAPEQNTTTGNIQGLVLSDPTNRRLDQGASFVDQRHTFVMSIVGRPQFTLKNRTLNYIVRNNQVGIIATANSGETFNVISGLDLNGDGILTSDRPVGIRRNAGKTPPQYNIDLRYSRFFYFSERFQLEVFAELQNILNINSITGYSNVRVATNPATGELIGTLPDFEARNQSTSQDSRQFQLGFKFIF